MLGDLRLTLPQTYGVATYPPGATFGPRPLRDWEFVWVIEGDARYRWNRDLVAAPEGSVVLCRPPATDFFFWDEKKRTRHGFFHFDLQGVPAAWPDVSQWPLVRLPEEGDILRPLFRHLLTWIGRGDALQCQLTMANLLAAFLSGDTALGDVPHEALPPPVERAWNYVHARLEDEPHADIPLAVLADVACVTPPYLCRLFKTATGWSPGEMVRLARLDHAAVLLARSNYSVGEIALLCGFASPFHFSRRFKAAFGHSPTDLRRAILAGAAPPTSRLLRFRGHRAPS